MALIRRVGPGTRLKGKRVAIIVAQEFEDIELLYPFVRLSEEGAEVIIVPVKRGIHPRPALHDKPITGRYGTPIPLQVFREGERHLIRELKDVKVEDIDAIIIPGGFSPDNLRIVPDVLEFVKKANEQGKVIAAICHGPQVLISAGIIRGRKATGFLAVKDDLINAGAEFVNQPAVKDGNIITARVPDDLPEFCQLIIEAMSSR
ncbi:MAG: type 1 glutamine amidotransferase domain-containing protein [Desulfurococcaceae archaeon]